ncbi:ABC transporter substrate-binding protein [Pseudobacteriovorax antillogorgiicola]|uniref:ABC-type branched-chain amino acid transport system, substrate-binding protein n=1 Tax=Pseudobacteriovorax antillogorgiicola TaxID=1513793 RepID=A0A1Y6BM10_9BACT|nr:ABC transporter substrate-binding protein [Pseudobacteriovorax antillogorgiicola]TCS54526.1 ABC-type branched-subunit amino acid transport system substrate-binding protein [Pseudobacteriovorax antillogorgiicola]SMF18778.1 ABC-type branched-chain amino acid transport system, substrate-binding protein [Pseudobacteriovorax antillogorgiicola]
MKRLVFCLAFAVFISGSAHSSGVTDTKIVLGTVNATSGLAKALGTGMNQGLSAYFDKVNKEGGIHGRTIEVIFKDDGYEPRYTLSNLKEIESKVLAYIGFVGTPTSRTAIKYSERSEMVYFGAFTGANLLRTAETPHVYNVRASYDQETKALVDHFVSTGKKRFGVFFQKDAYGKAGLSGVKKALGSHKLEVLAKGNYRRNSLRVEKAIEKLKQEKLDAIIMIGAYQPCAEAIKKMKSMAEFKGTQFANISFVGTSELINELGDQGNGVIISQVMPSPWTSKLPIVKEYREHIKDYSYVSLEGFVVAKVFAEALRKIGKNIDKQALHQGLSKFKKDIGGLTFDFDNPARQALQKIYLTRIQKGKPVAL